MRYVIKDTKYHFKSAFDTDTGAYVRTGILDEKGKDTGVDPFMASFPHLIDVGIMGHCIHGRTGLCAKAGIGCYQNGLLVEQPNMTVEDFRWIAEQCRRRCNQFALGGRGDPDQHEYFEELLRISRENDLVPNFTTSGYGMTPELAALCMQYCGAVAVSWYRSDYTLNAIQMLLDAGVKTNIHYVLGKNSIDEAIDRLERDEFPSGINAVIFLLHKPAGQGSRSNVLDFSDPRVEEFFCQVDKRHPFKVGMDSCNVPGALNYCKRILPESLDTCEGGRYSCYIGADMVMMPCSFDQQKVYEVQLSKGITIEDAWNSESFENFRNKMRGACPDCEKRVLCMGGCPLMPEIVFCNSEKRINKQTIKEGGNIMKIRTDFVTNSSSSSFILTLRFDLVNGEKIEWSGMSDCGEGYYAYCLLAATKSPRELGECDSIDALITMVKESIIEGYTGDEEDEGTPVFSDSSVFIQSVKKLSSMDEIETITVEGYEDTLKDYENGPEANDEIVTYNMKEKQQKAISIGVDYIESEGTGGYLAFEREATEQETPEGYFDEKRKAFSFEEE